MLLKIIKIIFVSLKMEKGGGGGREMLVRGGQKNT